MSQSSGETVGSEVAELNGVRSTRSRIRNRALPEHESPSNDIADHGEELANEENRWLTIRFDELVTGEEEEGVRSKIWQPMGYPDKYLVTLRARVDYRQAWLVGNSGATCVQSRCPGALSKFVPQKVYVKFDGTDTNCFMKIYPLEGTRSNVATYYPLTLPPTALYNATFNRVVGSISIHSVELIRPSIPEAVSGGGVLTLNLVKLEFIDALVYCIWEMQVQLQLNQIRLSRFSAKKQQQYDEEERRRDASRNRAVALSETVFDERPERSKASTALVKPKPWSRIRSQ